MCHRQAESFPAAEEGGAPRFYTDLPYEERDKILKDRLKKYCQKVRCPREGDPLNVLAAGGG